jgi:hypothetical protein
MRIVALGAALVMTAGVALSATDPSMPENLQVKSERVNPSKLKPEERLQGACDVTKILVDDLKVGAPNLKAQSDLGVLQNLVCAKAN